MRSTTSTVARRLAQAFLLLVICGVGLQAAAEAPKRFRVVSVALCGGNTHRFTVTASPDGDARAVTRVSAIAAGALQPAAPAAAPAAARPLDIDLTHIPPASDADEMSPKLRQKHHRALLQLSFLHNRLGDHDQAIRFAREALTYDTSPQAIFQIANALDRRGDAALAITWYQRWLDGAPKGRIQENIQERIQRLQATL